MKRLFYALAGIIILAGSQGFRSTDEKPKGRRLALIVAIANYKNNYGPNEQWGHLSSLRDDTIITAALQKQNFDTIMHVQDAQATIDGIRKAFAALTKMIRPGDMVYIHFSSHGQQIWDDNGDEMDGLDECIVTYDAPMHYHEGYKGEKHLRDDELGVLVNRVRMAAGKNGDVWVASDACHSGTTLRGPICRGTEPPMTPPDYDPLKKQDPNAGSVDEFTANSEEMAPVALFSASMANETNQECRAGYGSLSFAITQALPRLQTGETYNALFAYVNAEMAAMKLGQTPMLEGNVNHPVFGGSRVLQSNYYNVRFVKTGILVVDGGTLSGLYVGSKVAVMPAGSTSYDPAKAIYTGNITSAEMAKSLISIDKDLSDYSPKQLWVFMVEQAYGAEKLSVGFGDGINGKLKNDIKQNILKLDFVQWDDKSADLLVNAADGKYFLSMPDGRKPFKTFDDFHAINEQLNSFMQGKMMGEATFSDPDLRVELSFTPQHFNGYDDKGDAIITDVNMSSKLVNGAWELLDDDIMLMTLSNTGHKDAYVNILEIDPAGLVNVVLPDYENNQNPVDFLLPAGKTIQVSQFARHYTGPQYGKYIYKVFATDVPVSFRGIFNSRGAEKQEYTHPAAKLFGESFSATRGGDNLKISKTSGGGTTMEYVVRLNPKK